MRPDFAEPPLTAERRGPCVDALAPSPALAIGYRVPDPVADLPRLPGQRAAGRGAVRRRRLAGCSGALVQSTTGWSPTSAPTSARSAIRSRSATRLLLTLEPRTTPTAASGRRRCWPRWTRSCDRLATDGLAATASSTGSGPGWPPAAAARSTRVLGPHAGRAPCSSCSRPRPSWSTSCPADDCARPSPSRHRGRRAAGWSAAADGAPMRRSLESAAQAGAPVEQAAMSTALACRAVIPALRHRAGQGSARRPSACWPTGCGCSRSARPACRWSRCGCGSRASSWRGASRPHSRRGDAAGGDAADRHREPRPASARVELRRLGGASACRRRRRPARCRGSALAADLAALLELLAEASDQRQLPRATRSTASASRLVHELVIARSQPAVLAGEALAGRMYGDHPYAPDAARAGRGRGHPAKQLRNLHADCVRPAGAVWWWSATSRPARCARRGRKPRSPAGRAAGGGPVPALPGHRCRARCWSSTGRARCRRNCGWLARAAPRTSPGIAALQLANSIFGGYFSSRLVENIREDKGYTYCPRSRIDHRRSALVRASAPTWPPR